jgi:hypothetical protein
MSDTVFYSWQSDLPNATNRGLIGAALEKAAKALRNDETLQIEPVIDRDTAGVPGIPDIGATIFEKIANAQVFVCDVSLINQQAQKPTPNPNVLIELGYALSVLGSRRIIMVMNQAFGPVEQLPFDLRIKRALTYSAMEADTERAPVRRSLEAQLTTALRAIFEELAVQRTQQIPLPISPGEEARESIEHGRANHVLLARRYMTWLIEQLDALNPALTAENPDELLIAAIELAAPLVTDFGHLSEVISATNSQETANIIYKGFEPLLQRYDYDPNKRGSGLNINGHPLDYDFYKFVGHELFVTFFSFFIRDGQWQLIGDLLNESFYIQDHARRIQQTRSFDYANDHIVLLEHRNRRLKLNFMTLHGKLLAERHSEGELGRVVPLQQFMDADLLLFLRSNHGDDQSNWDPFSTSNMYNLPRYLVEAVQRRYAERLLKPIGVDSIDMLCHRLARRKAQHIRWFDSRMHYDSLEGFDVDSIGKL